MVETETQRERETDDNIQTLVPDRGLEISEELDKSDARGEREREASGVSGGGRERGMREGH